MAWDSLASEHGLACQRVGTSVCASGREANNQILLRVPCVIEQSRYYAMLSSKSKKPWKTIEKEIHKRTAALSLSQADSFTGEHRNRSGEILRHTNSGFALLSAGPNTSNTNEGEERTIYTTHTG
jgi:hypothetical protein